MATRTATPIPGLADSATVAREARRAHKRANHIFLKPLRKVAIALAVTFAILGLGGGVSQAWFWDIGENIAAFASNFCSPMNLDVPSGHEGIDTSLGLNQVETLKRGSYLPPNIDSVAGAPGDGLDRVRAAYGNAPGKVLYPTYERYGFASLKWDNYGAPCFSQGAIFSPLSNAALGFFVHFPVMISMAMLNLALGNSLYIIFAAIISPFVGIFTAIYTPWIFVIAPVGVLLVFARTRSAVATLKAAAWVLFIVGVLSYSSVNTVPIVRTANNIVTEVGAAAADQINAINATNNFDNSVEADVEGAALKSINQSLWYGIPYQTWLEGQVGPRQAAEDRTTETEGKLGWGPALLNGNYANKNDKTGKRIQQAAAYWNTLTYSPSTDPESKTGYWTGADGGFFGTDFKDAAWEEIPYLFNVKAMCNDTATDGPASKEADKNQWMYGGNCDSAGAGTSDMVPYFTGENYNERFVTAAMGGVGANAVSITVTVVSLYLAVQKMVFYFLLLFAPIFLVISTFADQQRRQFAIRYFGVVASNVIKQSVAVIVVLFVSNSMSLLLYPPQGVGGGYDALRSLPWVMKPMAALLVFIGLVLFAIPLKKIITAAVKGDATIVNKTANAPANATKAAVKVAAVAAVTGGVGLAAGAAGAGAAGAAGAGKGAALLQTASRAVGTRGGTGQVLATAGRMLRMKGQVGGAMAQRDGAKTALANGVKTMTSGAQGEEYMSALKKKKGMVGEDGQLTAAGRKQAEKDFKDTVGQGDKAAAGAQMQAMQMKKYFEGHRTKTGNHHELDPQNPVNVQARKVEAEQERQKVYGAASKESARSVTDGGPSVAGQAKPNSGDGARPNNGDGAAREAFADKARSLSEGPSFGRDGNIKANVEVSGAEVLSKLGLSQNDVTTDPSKLLTSEVYGGGHTTSMDPRHPATASLNNLRFAMLNGDEESGKAAAVQASEAIATHGVPDHIRSIGSTGSTAASFEPINVIGAMPNITADTPWQERAEAATTMQAAAAMIPQDSPAAEPMNNYVQALSTPTVEPGTVDALQVQAIRALNLASNDTFPDGDAALFSDVPQPQMAGAPSIQGADRYEASSPTMGGDASYDPSSTPPVRGGDSQVRGGDGARWSEQVEPDIDYGPEPSGAAFGAPSGGVPYSARQDDTAGQPIPGTEAQSRGGDGVAWNEHADTSADYGAEPSGAAFGAPEPSGAAFGAPSGEVPYVARQDDTAGQPPVRGTDGATWSEQADPATDYGPDPSSAARPGQGGDSEARNGDGVRWEEQSESAPDYGPGPSAASFDAPADGVAYTPRSEIPSSSAPEQEPPAGPSFDDQPSQQGSGPSYNEPSYALPTYDQETPASGGSGAANDYGYDVNADGADHSASAENVPAGGEQRDAGITREEMRDVLREDRDERNVLFGSDPSMQSGESPMSGFGGDAAAAAAVAPLAAGPDREMSEAVPYDPPRRGAEEPEGGIAADDDDVQSFRQTRRRRRSSMFGPDADADDDDNGDDEGGDDR